MLKHLSFQGFRNYGKNSFEFPQKVTLIVGPNTAGKSNFIESIFLLSTGKSFRAEKDSQMVAFGKEMARVSAKTHENDLEVVVTVGEVAGVKSQFKRFLVNGVAKRRVDFVGNLNAVLFSPEDLEIIIGSPGIRRNFLDNVLEQTDREYRQALLLYVKGIKQRNALLEFAKDRGIRNEKEFTYWDNLVITNGQIVTRKREEFINYLNGARKDIFDMEVVYDRSIISTERLLHYADAEKGSGVTLVGPHRDDFYILFGKDKKSVRTAQDKQLKYFGSRGQQRLGVLQLKLLELEYIRGKTKSEPLLLLDDVFSELDESHINLILGIRENQQTIITTTHEEFVPASLQKTMEVINL